MPYPDFTKRFAKFKLKPVFQHRDIISKISFMAFSSFQGAPASQDVDALITLKVMCMSTEWIPRTPALLPETRVALFRPLI